MKNDISINLKYSGPGVDDGTMPVDDLIATLQGFSNAFEKISVLENLGTQYKLRVTKVRRGSFDVVLIVWNQLGQISGQLQAIEVLATGVVLVITTIFGLVKLKKHIKKQPFKESFDNVNNSIIITNSENVQLNISPQIHYHFKNNSIAQDLARFVKPLDEEKITEAEMSADFNGKTIQETISLEEKPFFDVDVVPATKTDKIWLTGKFNSLTKTTNKGYFYLSDGAKVSYTFSSEKPENMYQDFAYNGPVRVECIALLDESLKALSIEIFRIEKLQEKLFADDENERKS